MIVQNRLFMHIIHQKGIKERLGLLVNISDPAIPVPCKSKRSSRLLQDCQETYGPTEHARGEQVVSIFSDLKHKNHRKINPCSAVVLSHNPFFHQNWHLQLAELG